MSKAQAPDHLIQFEGEAHDIINLGIVCHVMPRIPESRS
jgi:hypothetical protein